MAAYRMIPVRGGWKGRYVVVRRDDPDQALLLDAPRAGLCPAVFDSPEDARGFLAHVASRASRPGAPDPSIRIDPADGVIKKADPSDFLPNDVVYLVRSPEK